MNIQIIYALSPLSNSTIESYIMVAGEEENFGFPRETKHSSSISLLCLLLAPEFDSLAESKGRDHGLAETACTNLCAITTINSWNSPNSMAAFQILNCLISHSTYVPNMLIWYLVWEWNIFIIIIIIKLSSKGSFSFKKTKILAA